MTEAQDKLAAENAMMQEKQAQQESTEDKNVQTTLQTHDQLYTFLCKKGDISWQQMIYQAVKSEHMDPWNIDVSMLSQRFLTDLKTMKEMDFAVSGKMILAAAIMVRLKSTKLVGEDLTYLDQLIASGEQSEEDAFYEELAAMDGDNSARVNIEGREYTLLPRTPQPRKRKVSVYDLVEALEKALEVKKRRSIFEREVIHMKIPEKSVDIEALVLQIFGQVKGHFSSKKDEILKFTHLLKEGTKMDKVMTFLPLLHLSNAGKIALAQEQHLGDIHISLGHTADDDSVDVPLE
jgi:segregation and condensation protein A